MNRFVHTEALRVTPREVENRISDAVPGFRTAKKALEAPNHIICRWFGPLVEHLRALWRCEHSYSHQNPSKTPKMGENHFEYVIVSLRTGNKHWRLRNISHDDGSATYLRFLMLSVMARWLTGFPDCTS